MKANRRMLGTAWAARVALTGCCLTAPASAAVIATGATVLTTVQELIDGEPASVNSDRERLTPGSSQLPLIAAANLTSTGLDGTLVSLGQGFGEFADPTRLDQPNPEEFALEVACYSNAESVSYIVTSSAVESRTVVFTAPGNAAAPPEIEFGLTATREIESRVFLSGAVVIWSTDPDKSLDGILSELRVTVTRDDGRTPLFETTFAVTGDGGQQLQPTATGPIRFETIELDELLDAGVDRGSASILQGVADEGTLIVLVIPTQEHAYTYTVSANEEFVLSAKVEARVRNIPGGSGVAATLGRPFRELADFIEQALPGVDGAAIQRSVNRTIAKRDLGLVSRDDTGRDSSNDGMCGAFGIEAAAMLWPGLFLALGRSSPRRAQPARMPLICAHRSPRWPGSASNRNHRHSLPSRSPVDRPPCRKRTGPVACTRFGGRSPWGYLRTNER